MEWHSRIATSKRLIAELAVGTAVGMQCGTQDHHDGGRNMLESGSPKFRFFCQYRLDEDWTVHQIWLAQG
jgi:hypothetical protein